MKTVKILHSSDWHLGKRLFKQSRAEEHKEFLQYLLKYLKENSIDILIIAGDIFDSPHPPHESIQQFFDFLAETAKLNIESIIIAGNHDSGVFIESPSPIVKNLGIHVSGQLIEDKKINISKTKILIERNGIKINFSLIPYFRNWELETLALERKIDLDTSENIIKLIEDVFIETKDERADYNILVSHHLFGPYGLSGSEQGIGLLLNDSIPINICTKHFDYTALGHIHKRQAFTANNRSVVYSGSPFPMRFSESINKSFELIEISSESLTHKKIELPILRNFIRIQLSSSTWNEDFEKFKSNYSKKGSFTPFVEVQMTLDEVVPGLFENIKNRIEDEIGLLISFTTTMIQDQTESKSVSNILSKLHNIEELFSDFYKSKYPESEINQELLSKFHECLEETRSINRGIES